MLRTERDDYDRGRGRGLASVSRIRRRLSSRTCSKEKKSTQIPAKLMIDRV
jgi:hypothetical protein